MKASFLLDVKFPFNLHAQRNEATQPIHLSSLEFMFHAHGFDYILWDIEWQQYLNQMVK